MTTATKRKSAEEGGEVFDRELVDLPRELRWREWMGRIEAVLFASASPVGRDDLARVVGQGASIEMLIEDIEAELTGRPYELVQAATGWMFRTRVQFAEAIKAAPISASNLWPSPRWRWVCSAPSPITSRSTGRV